MNTDNKLRVFNGATAIITGGASGIGLAFAEQLVKYDCDVVIADLQLELAEEAANRLNKSGGKVKAVKIDVTNPAGMEQLIQETFKRTGRIDYMFNNAGIVMNGPCSIYKSEDWKYIIDVNLFGVINGIQAVYKIMIDQGFGHIVNTSSMAGLMPGTGTIGYDTTKHAVLGLSLSLRGQAKLHGVKVTALCPGFVRTAILDKCGKYGRPLRDFSPEQHRIMREMLEKAKPMDVEVFAQKALELIAKNRAVIILPYKWRIISLINRLFPSLVMKMVELRYFNALKKLGFNPGIKR